MNILNKQHKDVILTLDANKTVIQLIITFAILNFDLKGQILLLYRIDCEED